METVLKSRKCCPPLWPLSLFQIFLSAPWKHRSMKGRAGFSHGNLILLSNLKSHPNGNFFTYSKTIALIPKCLVGRHSAPSSNYWLQTIYYKVDLVPRSSCHPSLPQTDVSCSFRNYRPCAACAFLVGCFWAFVLAASLYNKTKGF